MKLLLLTLIPLVFSHSWLYCVDYNKQASLKVGSIQSNFCNSFPRSTDPTLAFGQDIGLDFIPSPGGNVCKAPTQPSRQTVYQQGKSYRLVWPAKNHDAEVCTNPFIPDTRLQLYSFPTELNVADPSMKDWTDPAFLLVDFKANGGSGFQNCPDFCTNTDRAPCFGDVKIPDNYPPGRYKMLWLWEFNPGQIYTHCFDVTITGNNNPPSVTPSPSVTPPSVTPSPNGTCIQVEGSCKKASGGCCQGLSCVSVNGYSRRCLNATGCLPRYSTCSGDKSCCSRKCKRIGNGRRGETKRVCF